MSRAGPVIRGGHGWQLILADLALILFLLTLSALPAAEAESGRRLAERDAREKDARRIAPAPPPPLAPPLAAPEIAAAQALFRPMRGGPTLAEWLAAQPRDPRATLTIFARHRRGEQQRAWDAAAALARDAQDSGVAVRAIVSAGQDSDVYASLAYDAPTMPAGE